MGRILQSKKPVADSELGFLLAEMWDAIENRLPVQRADGLLAVDYTPKGQSVRPILPPAPSLPARYHPFRIFNTEGRTFRVRSGIVSGFRPKFYSLTDNPFANGWVLLNHSEPACRAVKGTDWFGGYTGAFNYDGAISASYTTEDVAVTDLEVDYFASGAAVANFILPEATEEYPDAEFPYIQAGFFLKFTDGADSSEVPVLRVGCRLFNAIASVDAIYPFATAPDEIPIGMVMIDSAGATTIEQFHYNHIWRNLPTVGVATGLATAGFGQPGIYRGDYDDDSLSGQMMYPCDLVRRTTSEIYEGFAQLHFYEIYQAESYFRCSGSPHADSRFKLVSKGVYNADGFP